MLAVVIILKYGNHVSVEMYLKSPGLLIHINL